MIAIVINHINIVADWIPCLETNRRILDSFFTLNFFDNSLFWMFRRWKLLYWFHLFMVSIFLCILVRWSHLVLIEGVEHLAAVGMTVLAVLGNAIFWLGWRCVFKLNFRTRWSHGWALLSLHWWRNHLIMRVLLENSRINIHQLFSLLGIHVQVSWWIGVNLMRHSSKVIVYLGRGIRSHYICALLLDYWLWSHRLELLRVIIISLLSWTRNWNQGSTNEGIRNCYSFRDSNVHLLNTHLL